MSTISIPARKTQRSLEIQRSQKHITHKNINQHRGKYNHQDQKTKAPYRLINTEARNRENKKGEEKASPASRT